MSGERIRHEVDRAHRAARDLSSAVDVLGAYAAAIPDWLPEGASLRLERPRNARKWRAALYDGNRCVASAYGERPSVALAALRVQALE